MSRDALKLSTFANMTKMLANLSTCKRRKQASMIISSDYQHVYGLGYNGAPAKCSHCEGIDRGKNGCGCVHAELNACLKACIPPGEKCILICTQTPCLRCAQAIINKQSIRTVFFLTQHENTDGLDALKEAGILWICLTY